jgi:hypothetical protein
MYFANWGINVVGVVCKQHSCTLIHESAIFREYET